MQKGGKEKKGHDGEKHGKKAKHRGDARTKGKKQGDTKERKNKKLNIYRNSVESSEGKYK